MTISFSGLASGLDTSSWVESLVALKQAKIDTLKEEKENARCTYFTTPFGKRLSLYEDLYTLPEDPEEACLASQGIYLNEPNILDFLHWLEPADTAQL